MGPEATAALEELVQRSGGEVMIDAVERDRYDRLVAEVWSDEVGLWPRRYRNWAISLKAFL